MPIDSTRGDNPQATRGQSVVELTLLLPILLWICAGIVDFGRVYYYDIVAINAARSGARIAADTRRSDAEVVTAVQVDVAGAIISGASLTITISPSGTRSPADTATVTVQYTFTPITPLIGSILPGGQLTVARSASMVAS